LALYLRDAHRLLTGPYLSSARWVLVAAAAIGILSAIGMRVALLATGLAEVLPLQLFVCVSAGLTVATVTWLLWFAP
jgi:hypothetical protein